MEKRFVVRIKGELIDVPEEVYRAYYSEARRERTQIERDTRNRLVYYNARDTEKSTGAESIASNDSLPEDVVIARMSAEKIKRCLERLTDRERELIHALFYCDETVAGLSRKLGVPRKTLESHRNKILKKLRVYFESPDRV